MNETKPDHPQPCREPSPEEISRRRFLERTSIALVGLGAAIVTLPLVGFILAPLFRKEPAVWRTVGSVDNFKIGETSSVTFLDSSPLPWAGVTAKTAAWLRRTGDQDFIAFAITCSHLGCPVRWLESARLFMCPCHGGVYYEDGTVAAGPPPRPLTRYSVRVRDGEVQIETKPVVVKRA
jgi:menaquinol-cytochrome c reductase iron-sulfur subunit